MKLLVDTGKIQKSVSHRPAELFQFNKVKYLKLKSQVLASKSNRLSAANVDIPP